MTTKKPKIIDEYIAGFPKASSGCSGLDNDFAW